jgi:hypothetical protein
MEFKDLIGLGISAGIIPVSILACCSRRIRDVAFFLMIALSAILFKVAINFDSHFWYRGTTRGFEFSIVDILAIGVLGGSLLRPRPGQQRWFWPASLGLMLFFFFFACINVGYSDPKIFGLFELSKMVRGIIVFLAAAMFVRSNRELSILVLALCADAIFEGALGIKEKLAGNWRVPGTLDDPNSLSMYLCTIAPIFVAAANSDLPRFVRRCSIVALLAASVGVVLTVSRAGIPIFAFVVCGCAFMCVSWRITIKKIYVAFFLMLILGGLFYKASDMIEARWSGDSFRNEYYNTGGLDSRGYYLRLMAAIERENFWGVGLNNWSYWVSKKYAKYVQPYEADNDYDSLPPSSADIRQVLNDYQFAAPAHCLAALTIGELGIPGFLIFGLLWLRWFHMGARFLWPRVPDAMSRMGVGIFFGTCGIFLQSITEWVFRQTHIFFTFNALIGTLAVLCWMRKQNRLRRDDWEFEEEEFVAEENVEDEDESEPVAVA